ncbi:MAG: CBS domain-containing protein [Anaerolineae bacterium]|nr:CBS domain-containing protein [Anaerolineae bacterium]MCB0251152.1 CBS domain-containing protein [Anaerolineae bacterium]MCB9142015.1 CBS domain-containing protein [Anaerolineales bacterium]MCO5242879.1 CBS domain-containing protein [Anaerolineae bacterium]
MNDLHVKDWMTRRVITVDPRTSLPDAHKLMRTNNIRRLPVVERGRLVGIVTRSDIREASPSEATTLSIWEMHYQLSKLSVAVIMTKDPYTVTPDTTIKDAAKLMYTYKFGGLPVVNDAGELQGIMTESDIFRILIAWFDEQEGGN